MRLLKYSCLRSSIQESSKHSAMTARRVHWRCKPSPNVPRSFNTRLNRLPQASSGYQPKINFTWLSLKSIIFPTINMESFEDSPDAGRNFGNDESVAALLPHTQSPPRRPYRSQKYRDERAGSGGTNPARRFWTRLPVALRPRSNFSAVILAGELKCSQRVADELVSAIRLEPEGRLVWIIVIGQRGPDRSADAGLFRAE